MSTGRIPLFKVFMSSDVDSELWKVLHSGYIGEGTKVDQFEQAVSRVVDNDKVLAVNSGTSALTLALKLAGVGPGTYVIATPMTCLATNEPILNLGANIIWADVEPTTGNISVQSVNELLIKYNHVNLKAIMCVHWGGYSCDMLVLRMLAEKYGVRLIEDAAHAFGGVDYNGPIGKNSDLCCFSFQAIKHLTTGDGGALVCKTIEEYERAKKLRWFGLERTGSLSMRCLQDPVEAGYKFHMNDIAATIGLCNLKALEHVLGGAFSHAVEYDSKLGDLGILPKYCRESTYWLYPILVDDPADFTEYMKVKGIDCSQVHVRNDKKQMFKSAISDGLEGLEYFSSRQVNIPVGWWLDEQDVGRVIDAVRSY